MDGRVRVGVVRMAVVRAIKVEPIEVDARWQGAFSPFPKGQCARFGNCLQRGAGCSAGARPRSRRLHGLVYSIQSSEAPPVAQHVSTVASIKK